MSNVKSIHFHEKANRIAAQVILADIEKHGGEGSLMVEWARSILREPKKAA